MPKEPPEPNLEPYRDGNGDVIPPERFDNDPPVNENPDRSPGSLHDYANNHVRQIVENIKDTR